MEILLDNPLATMYGPYFLVFYGFVIVFTLLVLGLKKTQIDKTHNLALPPIPSQIDPYEIAYLRGGTNEVARSVIFALMQKGLIEIDNSATTPKIQRIENSGVRSNLNPIEQISLDWIAKSRDVSEVFGGGGLTKQLEIYGEMYKSRLEQAQLLVGDEARAQMSRWKWIAMAIIAGLGIYKIFAAVVFGNFNFIFTILLLIFGLIIAQAVSGLPRLTKLGKAYLERLQLAFENLKFESQKPYLPTNEPRVVQQTTFAGVDPLLLSVGVFGGTILAGTVFDNYNQAFQRAQHQSAISSGGSCGSSCGSCSSSDGGGSSCSSGSSCGGGCGGCGGGD
jgi:uncharacterized protein (TIGR04222 family)